MRNVTHRSFDINPTCHDASLRLLTDQRPLFVVASLRLTGADACAPCLNAQTRPGTVPGVWAHCSASVPRLQHSLGRDASPGHPFRTPNVPGHFSTFGAHAQSCCSSRRNHVVFAHTRVCAQLRRAV